jgi:crossover junction endodeoxyribonuclease RuvC
MLNLIAIDPGFKGGIAYCEQIRGGLVVSAIKMPMAGKDIDISAIAGLVKDVRPNWAVVEKVGAMPGQGVVSMFRFGMGYGQILGCLAACGVPVELVTPQRWKGRILAGTKKDKDAAVAYCRRVFPSISLIPARCRSPHDGIADALCLLEYGRRELEDRNFVEEVKLCASR